MIEPVDETRCQAEIREGSFMTFGPRKMVRCVNVPVVVVTEKEPGTDGECGAMSLCEKCWEILQLRTDLPSHTTRSVTTTKSDHRRGRIDHG